MKNSTNFIFALILCVAAASGCQYSYETGGKKETNSPSSKKTSKNSSGKKNSDERKSDDADEEKISTDAGDMEMLAGKWIWVRTGSSTVSDSGVYTGGNGSRFTYEFSADGAVTYTGAMSVVNGGCQMLVTLNSEGQATLDGDQSNIEWQPGTSTRDDSCSSSQNYTKETPAETQNMTVRFQKKSGQEQLCLIEKEETCFSRADE